MNRKQGFIVGGLMAASVVVGALIATDFRQIPFGLAGPDVKLGADAPPVVPSNEVKALNDAFVAVSKAVTQQVVSIEVTTRSEQTSNQEDEEDILGGPWGGFNFRMPNTPQRGSGSGVIITPDGYILTNNHVVESAERGTIEVELSDGRKMDAKLVGRDPLTDLAVIKVDATGLPVAALANSDEVQVGQFVIAVGSPLGLNSTVTQGIVSALGRGQLNLNRDERGYGVEDFIQTDAAINPGNSGGGLFDLRGALVGINSAIASRTGYYQGYGFAIPINLARAVAQDLIEDGKVNRGYIGVKIEPVSQSLKKALGMGAEDGVLIQETMPGTSAADAGLRQGDVILTVDGVPVKTPNHLQNLLAQKRAGDEVKLKIFRDGSTFEKGVKLKPRAEDAEEDASASNNTRENRDESSDSRESAKLSGLGMEVQTLDGSMKKRLGVSSGVLVTSTEMYGEAMTQGISSGDVIVSANRKQVKTAGDLEGIVSDASKGDVILMQVKTRGGSTRLVALEVK
ncbi:MAG: Do family serine endopeptidase [Chlorobi bacterium]|nr:MAG: Trypsin-like serine protease [Chlorobi bacterium OLB7]MBK8910149.1 Do family serine endopeptidase [Chlorobiota bacterium]MBX7217671.1 Do family serine endopeptidase [Candidatus Kapabacteria bacterium]